MSEIFLDCDSPCVSCSYNRVFKIENYNGRFLHGSYYCANDGILYLCKKGVGFRMVRGQMRPFCPRCDRELGLLNLSYNQGKDFRPFGDDILLIVRIPLQSRFDITKVLKGSYFKDLSDVLLYIYFNEGEGEYNIVRYRKIDNQYSVVFSGNITAEDIQLEIVKTEEIEVPE
ncbi:MAG TPA: hypothetical protein VMX55_05435 [candidate division Zixibacteria bacterium]|nr:hypothetical protein [candidate division Zixibacteria bacterium]